MDSLGIIRKVDGLGRIVIPAESRRELGWSDNALIKIYPFGRYILLKALEEKDSVLTLPNNPVINDIQKALNELTDSDLLLTLEFLHRLEQGPISEKVSE